MSDAYRNLHKLLEEPDVAKFKECVEQFVHGRGENKLYLCDEGKYTYLFEKSKVMKKEDEVTDGKKRCERCEKIKDTNEFEKCKRREGYRTWCKQCDKETKRVRICKDCGNTINIPNKHRCLTCYNKHQKIRLEQKRQYKMKKRMGKSPIEGEQYTA